MEELVLRGRQPERQWGRSDTAAPGSAITIGAWLEFDNRRQLRLQGGAITVEVEDRASEALPQTDEACMSDQ